MVEDEAPSTPFSDEPPIDGGSYDFDAAMEHVQYKDQVHRRGENDGRRVSSQREPPVAVVPPSSPAMTPTDPPTVTAVQLVDEDSPVAQLRKEAADQAELVRNLQRQNTKSRKL